MRSLPEWDAAGFGAGPGTADMLLGGEQPGDQEEQQGQPFVGPAGMELNRVLEDLRIPRDLLYVTNAVKNFKFTERGKRRLHETPRMGGINACRPWLAAEIAAVKPKVVVCLGANAAKSLLGGSFSVLRDHGKAIASPFADVVYATIHPSAILRAPDSEQRKELHEMLSKNLAQAWRAAT
jgi:uracil-DNA glycosylase family protein